MGLALLSPEDGPAIKGVQIWPLDHRQPLHYIFQIRLRIEPVDLGQLNQAHDIRRPLSTAQRTGKKPIGRAYWITRSIFFVSGAEFEELKQDIAHNGLREQVWLYQKQILDGRNRYRACKELGTSSALREYEGDDPAGSIVWVHIQFKKEAKEFKRWVKHEVLPGNP